jgi:7-keto-8-aminopelargonate synthetase-like enzyme
MDGDLADLPALRQLCDAEDLHLYIDEAHALGVFGPHGGGLARERGRNATHGAIWLPSRSVALVPR